MLLEGSLQLVVIACLAFVQSLFGVGLLLFGTPLVLLFGGTFKAALWTLLPGSLTISLLQLLSDRSIERRAVVTVCCWTLPGLIVGLLFALNDISPRQIEGLVALALLGSGILRLSDRFSTTLRRFAETHERPILALTGLVHGLTNMGGSLLAAAMAARHVEKQAVRRNIALGYGIFAASQLAVLSLTDEGQLSSGTAATAIVAALVFVMVGQRSFLRISEGHYGRALSGCMIAMAGLLIFRMLG